VGTPAAWIGWAFAELAALTALTTANRMRKAARGPA
jgi:hypothetical protein